MASPEVEDKDFVNWALTACNDGDKNLPDDECLRKMRPYYNEAREMIREVEKGAEIYRGLDLNKFVYQRFIKDLTQSPPLKNRPLGQSWSFDEDLAHPVGEHHKNTLVIGRSPSKIDRKMTLYMNMQYEGAEKEIALEADSEIDVVSVCRVVDAFWECRKINRKAIV